MDSKSSGATASYMASLVMLWSVIRAAPLEGGKRPDIWISAAKCDAQRRSSRKMTGASRILREVNPTRTRSGSYDPRPSTDARILDPVDVRVGQAEMVTDLVDQHMADQVAETQIPAFGPFVEDRAAIEEDHGRRPI